MAERKAMIKRSRKKTESEKKEIFWSKVNKENDCWLWTGGISKSGYGNYRNNGSHRYAYEITFGEIPKGMLVMHKCDVRACVNPDHLSIGTHKDNSKDMVAKNRNLDWRGERHGAHKLKEKDVIYIREHYKRGINQTYPSNVPELAQQFNVSVGTIRQIVNFERWQWLKEKQ
jgi:hypothetical protein